MIKIEGGGARRVNKGFVLQITFLLVHNKLLGPPPPPSEKAKFWEGGLEDPT